VETDVKKKTAIERFVNPPTSAAPSGAGTLRASGSRRLSKAGFTKAVHVGYQVRPESTSTKSRMAP
jgi:hypothetical protein